MDENLPVTVGIIGAIFLGFMVISCEKAVSLARIPVEMEDAKNRSNHEKEMLEKGYHQNAWGNWVKDK